MGTEWGAGGAGMCPEVCGRGQRSGLFELLDGGGHLDVLSLLQPLLTLDQVVDAVHHRLHQLHLEGEHTHTTELHFLSKTVSHFLSGTEFYFLPNEKDLYFLSDLYFCEKKFCFLPELLYFLSEFYFLSMTEVYFLCKKSSTSCQSQCLFPGASRSSAPPYL